MPEQEYADIQFIINDLSSRLRSLENKYNLITERLLVINKNMIDEYKTLTGNIKSNDSEIHELKAEIEKLKSTMRDLINELSYFAKKEDIKVLEKYINLWNPLKFTTEQDIENILKRKLKEVHDVKQSSSKD